MVFFVKYLELNSKFYRFLNGQVDVITYFLKTRAAVLNLGYAYPLGYVRSSQGVRKIFKNPLIGAYLGRIFDLGVREGDTSLVWGYAEG